MQGVIDGAPSRELSFREDDQLADVSATFNALMRHVGELEAAAPQRIRAEVKQAGAKPVPLGDPAV